MEEATLFVGIVSGLAIHQVQKENKNKQEKKKSCLPCKVNLKKFQLKDPNGFGFSMNKAANKAENISNFIKRGEDVKKEAVESVNCN